VCVPEGGGCVAPAADDTAPDARSTLQGRGVWAAPPCASGSKQIRGFAAPFLGSAH